jgi:two-component system NtrC family sensor kinase
MAQKLKELDRMKQDFMSSVTHELRSPLTAILGYVELIDRVGSVNEQQKEFIRRVQISVQNITALINDLLDLGQNLFHRGAFAPPPPNVHPGV